VEYELFYESDAPEGDLAGLPRAKDGVTLETNSARVTLRRQTGREGLRLEVTSNVGVLPTVQTQRNHVAESVASKLAQTEEWISVLGRSSIYLRCSAASPRCSVTVPDVALQGEGPEFVNGVLAAADNIVSGVLHALLGVTVTRVNPEN
jgi:hypothetical protein